MVLRRDTPTEDTTIDLAVLRDALVGARGRIMGAALVAAVAVAGAVAWRADPVVVEARILVEPMAIAQTPATGEGRTSRDDRLIATQTGLLGSSGLLRHAVDALAADPETLDALAPDEFGGDGLDRTDRRLARLREALAIERVDHSRVIALRLSTLDPLAGQRLLTAVWEEYAAGLAEARRRAEAEADRRRGAEVNEARHRLAEAERRPVAVAPSAPVSADPEREAALAERAEVEARLKRLTDLTAAGEAGAEKAVDAGLTGGLRQLREKRGLLRSRIAELSIVYLENHPLLKEATERLADLRRDIRAEVPRAVAALKADLATLDRRIGEHTATTASVPSTSPAEPDEAAFEAALTDALTRREAAYAEALGQAAVDVRLVGSPEVVETPSRSRPLLAAALAALVAAFLAGLVAVVRGLARPPVVEPEGEVVAIEAVVPVAPVRQSRPPFVRPVDPQAGLRAEVYAEAVEERIADLWRQIEAEIPRGRRIVVTSVADAARAHAASRRLWAHAARLGTPVCRVDLAGTVPDSDAALGFTDILAGLVGYSEAIFRHRDHGGWEVPPGLDPLPAEALGDEGVAGILDALALTWGDLVLDVGRLEPGEGLATVLLGADVIVLAEDDRDDPRALRALDALLSAGKAVWLLDPRLDVDAVMDADDEAALWGVAA